MGFDNDHLDTLMPFGAPSTSSFGDGLADGSKSTRSSLVLHCLVLSDDRAYPQDAAATGAAD
jgi:hypothetical protein